MFQWSKATNDNNSKINKEINEINDNNNNKSILTIHASKQNYEDVQELHADNNNEQQTTNAPKLRKRQCKRKTEDREGQSKLVDPGLRYQDCK